MAKDVSLCLSVALWLCQISYVYAEPLKAYVADFNTPAVIVDIDSQNGSQSVPPEYTNCNFNPPNTVFSVNFTSGLTYNSARGGVFFGLEWDGGNGPDIYLYAFSNVLCATGGRIGGQVGHTNLQSLAFCEIDGFFYSVDFDFASPHLGQLVRIDPNTGAGTLIGNHMAPDVRIVGMVCDTEGDLWAVTSGFGGPSGRFPELLKIDRTTGVETVIGWLNLPPNTVESLAIDPDFPDDLFAAGTRFYQVNKSTGAATLIGGTFDKVFSMAGPGVGMPNGILNDSFDASNGN